MKKKCLVFLVILLVFYGCASNERISGFYESEYGSTMEFRANSKVIYDCVWRGLSMEFDFTIEGDRLILRGVFGLIYNFIIEDNNTLIFNAREALGTGPAEETFVKDI